MSYQVLARKWRPGTFRDLVGQEHVRQALINALDRDRLHHAYLFTGTRGVGKTTIARILAKCLNCETGVSSEPCGQCSACREIEEGRFVDLIEVDAASRTKVEDTRELLENVQYAPTRGRYKVYLIDEVHMLSAHSFNALLKTLEEPPPHVKFLLATTDPQKLPATILSRCLQFGLRNLTAERIRDYLKSVLDQELIESEDGALWLLARAAEGSMRDALSLTDQAISFGSGSVTEADVQAMLGTIDRQSVFALATALVEGDGAGLLERAAQLADSGADLASVLDELMGLLHRLAIAQAVPGAVDDSRGDAERVGALAAAFSAEDVQLMYQIALNSVRDLPYAPDPRIGFEMAMLRMLAFREVAVPDEGDAQLPAARGAPAKKSVDREPALPVEPKAPAAAAGADGLPEEPAVEQRAPTPAVDVPKPPAAVAAPGPHTADGVGTAGSQWSRIAFELPLTGVAQNIALHSCLDAIDGACWRFTVNREQETLYQPAHAERLSEALSQHLGQAVEVSMTLGEPASETPWQRRVRERGEARQRAVEQLRRDRNVQTLLEVFGGTLDEETVQSLDRPAQTIQQTQSEKVSQ